MSLTKKVLIVVGAVFAALICLAATFYAVKFGLAMSLTRTAFGLNLATGSFILGGGLTSAFTYGAFHTLKLILNKK